MLIIAGKLYVSSDERQKWIDAHDVVKRARSTPGCVELYISADPVDERRVNMFEPWESGEALQTWRAVAVNQWIRSRLVSLPLVAPRRWTIRSCSPVKWQRSQSLKPRRQQRQQTSGLACSKHLRSRSSACLMAE